MIHKMEARSAVQVRRAHPDAAIIRHTGGLNWLAFDSVDDAFRHPTTITFKGQMS